MTDVERRLTTILCTDVKGYSRLMDDDEVATLETLRDYRRVITGFVERHRGRVVSTAGDGLLAEFGSVVEAVQCAAEIQRELAVRNLTLAADRRMEFRIGINLGDVMVEDDDLFGEGVNVAARLQELADPGGVYISGPVFDQVRNKLTLGYQFLGKQAVKNISQEVPVYRVQLDPGEAAPQRPPPPADGGAASWGRQTPWRSAEKGELRRHAARAGVLIAFLFAINALSSWGDWWFYWPALPVAAFAAWRYFSPPGDDRAGGDAS